MLSVGFEDPSYSATEGQPITFVIVLSREASIPVTVSFSTSDADARGTYCAPCAKTKKQTHTIRIGSTSSITLLSPTANSDYTPSSAITLTFEPGVTRLTRSVSTTTDDVLEDNEVFNAALSLLPSLQAGGRVELGRNEADGIITNDDGIFF